MKLLPCPFCGTHRTKLVRWPITPENFGAEIRCECGCRGPAGFGKSFIPMAADLWNRREHSAARIKRLEEDLSDAYAEMRKQYPVIKAVFDSSVWAKAKEAKP